MHNTDGYGRRVPARLDNVFALRREVAKIIDSLESAKSLVAGLGGLPGSECLSCDTAVEKLSEVIHDLRYGSPYRQCDCLAFSSCPKCESRRWQTTKEAILRK